MLMDVLINRNLIQVNVGILVSCVISLIFQSSAYYPTTTTTLLNNYSQVKDIFNQNNSTI